MLRLMLAAFFSVTLSSCALLVRAEPIARDLLVLRATWETPARQAGVLEQAKQAVARIDAAILSGNPVDVKAAIVELRPVYEQIRAEIDSPTPEQVAFDARVQVLWENINDSGIDWLAVAVDVVRALVKVV